MGTVINFPEARRIERTSAQTLATPATIMILPVIRIERMTDGPAEQMPPRSDSGTGRKRRRRARRS
jgi:hypothetical protein